MHQRARAFACISLLVTGPTSAWGQTLYQGVQEGQKYDVNLTTGRITSNGTPVEPLPFDVHFYLRSSVADAVTEVESSVRGFKQPKDCDDLDPVDGVDYVDCQRGAFCPAKTTQAKPRGEAGAREVKLLIPALEPNRYYCFLYTQTVTADEAVRLAVVAAIERFAREPRFLTSDAFEREKGIDDLRTAMLRAAEEEARQRLGSAFEVRAEPGTFFDVSVPIAQAHVAVIDEAGRFFTRQLNVNPARSTLRNRARQGAGLLTELNGDPRWRIVKRTLLDHAQEPRVGELLAGDAGALELIGDSGVDVVAWSEGHATGLLEDIWESAAIDYTPLRQQLIALERIARELRGDESLRATAGLSEEALQEELEAVCGSAMPDNEPVCSEEPATPLFFARLETLARETGRFFSANREDSIEVAAANLRDLLDARSGELTALTNRLMVVFFKVLRVDATTVADYETNAFWYVGADLGAALAWELEEGFTYAGANIYFRPVNKKARLTRDDWRAGHRFAALRQRLSLTVGLPQDEVPSENFEPVLQKRPAVVGLGWRLTNFLRVTPGVLVFRERDPNPLVDSKRLAWSPFLSLSLDWNIAGMMSKAFAGVFGSQAVPQQSAAPEQAGSTEEEP